MDNIVLGLEMGFTEMVCSVQLVSHRPFSGHLAFPDAGYMIMDSRPILHLQIVRIDVTEIGTAIY